MRVKVFGSGMLVAMITTVSLFLECTCFTLVVEKPYQQVLKDEPSKFMCQADVPLAGCQAKNLYSNKIYDISGGNSSSNYWGMGLENGQCGYFIISVWKVGNYFSFGFRARTHDGDWQYATAVAQFADNSTRILPVVTGPRSVLAAPGSDVTLTFTASEPLSQCSFQWPGQTTWIDRGTSTTYSVDNSHLAEGICRLTLRNVTANTSGIVDSDIKSQFVNGVQGRFIELTTLIVKMAPSAPALTLTNANGVFNEGDLMNASCYVGASRPVARISWLLGDDVIPGEVEDYSSWPWEYEAASVARKLSRKLSREDDGKDLVCRVHQVALHGGKTVIRKISVRESQFLGLPNWIAWLLVGAGGCLLCVAVVVAALIIHTRVTRKWCFASTDLGGVRESQIYDDVMDSNYASNEKKGEDSESAIYEDVG